jgi:hypothetical protein
MYGLSVSLDGLRPVFGAEGVGGRAVQGATFLAMPQDDPIGHRIIKHPVAANHYRFAAMLMSLAASDEKIKNPI